MDGKQRESIPKELGARIQELVGIRAYLRAGRQAGVGFRERTRNGGNVFGAAASRVRKPGAKGMFAALAKSSLIRRRAPSPFRNIGPAGFEPTIRQITFH
jgi:hypothetical protein